LLLGCRFLGYLLLLRYLTGRQSTLATVASTLLIAALFTPMGRRTQRFIDRRFYRRKYDARKTPEAFSAKLRDEMDLQTVSDDLVGVVRETMQPTSLCGYAPSRLGRGTSTVAAVVFYNMSERGTRVLTVVPNLAFNFTRCSRSVRHPAYAPRP
jgi:hypothetical protein